MIFCCFCYCFGHISSLFGLNVVWVVLNLVLRSLLDFVLLGSLFLFCLVMFVLFYLLFCVCLHASLFMGGVC